MRFHFPKQERLKSRKRIDDLFAKGKSINEFPLKLLYLETTLPENVPIQAGFSVAKRSFKLTVKRNRIKRLMRETYRLNKYSIFNTAKTSYIIMFLYLGRELPDFHSLNKTMKSILEKFKNKETLK